MKNIKKHGKKQGILWLAGFLLLIMVSIMEPTNTNKVLAAEKSASYSNTAVYNEIISGEASCWFKEYKLGSKKWIRKILKLIKGKKCKNTNKKKSNPTVEPTNTPTPQPEEIVVPTTEPITVPEKDKDTGTDTENVNPKDYEKDTTVTVLSASKVDITKRTTEFQGLVKECTKVAYAYADPRENADAKKNSSIEGAESFAVTIFGYDNTTQDEFLNAKKMIPYVLNKLYFDQGLHDTWYKSLVGDHGIYVILEKPENINGYAGVKFGNVKDGFGMRIGAGALSTMGGSHVVYHEMSHCIWDVGGIIEDFEFGVDPNTNIDYGKGNFIELYTKLYNNSISKNQFYSADYGWNYVHENYAECAAKFFDSTWRAKLKSQDPIVYRILTQIYTEY